MAFARAFDKIIAATNDHFWDPLDKRYIDYSVPFDLETQMVMPEEPFRKCGWIVQALSEKSVSALPMKQRAGPCRRFCMVNKAR